MISVRDLTARVSTGEEVLASMTFAVRAGGALGVYGPNGSGKSTLLRAMAGQAQDRALTGEVWVECPQKISVQIDTKLSPAEKVKKVLFLGSDFATPFAIAVRELFELGAEVSGRSQGDILEVVELLQIHVFLERNFQSLSDGEKQLMMFARVLIQRPQILIFDESFSKLDLDKLILVAKTLRNYCARGLTVILASHDLNFLTESADEMLLLKSGKKIAHGSVSEVLNLNTLGELFPELALHVVVSPETGRFKVLY